MSFDAHLIHTCTIKRAGKLTNVYGNTKNLYGPLYTDVPCRLVEKVQRGIDASKAVASFVTTYMLLVNSDTDLIPEDQISDIILESGIEAGYTFTVKSVLIRRGKAARHKSAVLESVHG